MRKFKIEIIVPEKTFYEGEIESLLVETSKGQICILASHAPMVIGLNPAMIVMKKDNEEMIAANGDGFVTVHFDKTIILCQTMEWAEDINLNRVNREIEKGKRKIKDAKNIIDYEYGKSTLDRAYARLRAINRINVKK